MKGFALALTTAVLWGALPVALKILLDAFDPYTLTAIRFVTASVLLIAVMAAMRRLSGVGRGLRRGWRWLLLAFAGLLGNFLMFLLALQYTSPTIAQTVSQLGPLFLLLGGLLFYRERFSPLQWAGLSLLALGLFLFFNRRWAELADTSGQLATGVGLALLGAALWATYGLAQKRLARHLLPQQTLMILYPAAALCLLPTSSPSELTTLGPLQIGLLAFACLNTVLAYGSFAESLKHLEASRVAAILSTTPLITAAVAGLAQQIAPALVAPEGLNAWSYAGVILVVLGSICCVTGSQRTNR